MHNFTQKQYEQLISSMPSVSPDWKADEKNLKANPVVEMILQAHFSGKKTADEHMIAFAWNDTKFPVGSREREIIGKVQDAIGYTFANERLLYQAFTRRSYAVEKQTFADNEVLELLGDSVLTATLYHLMLDKYSRFCTKDGDGSLFFCDLKEGEMAKRKERLASKDHLADRAMELGLDQYILFGKNDSNNTMDPKEDLIEAIVGAVAIDSCYDYEVLGKVVETLLDLHLDLDADEKDWDQFEELSTWCQKHFGAKPEYSVRKSDKTDRKGAALYDCEMILTDPGHESQTMAFHGTGETRSKARLQAAKEAHRFLVEQGYWLNLVDAGVAPKLANAINQLQELFQKKYIKKPAYSFADYEDAWGCTCKVGPFQDEQKGRTKTEAKKKAAFSVLISLMKASGLYDVAWSIELGDETVSYMDELAVFNREYPAATLEQKLDFIWDMQVKYDKKLALDSYREDNPNFYTALGVNHRNIGISLCKAMKLDHECLITYQKSCKAFTDPAAYQAAMEERKELEEMRFQERLKRYNFHGRETE